MPSAEARLRPDCASCAALCCVALDLVKGSRFAFDKPAGTPCRNLDTRHGCRIHADLASRGFPGCAAYDCLGAGQRVVQDLFDGLSWRDRPELLPDMIAAFADLRRVHDALELLVTARHLRLSSTQEATRRRLVAALAPERWSVDLLRARLSDGTLPEVRRFVAGLADAAWRGGDPLAPQARPSYICNEDQRNQPHGDEGRGDRGVAAGGFSGRQDHDHGSCR